ncbi:MAG: T9SS type A sorting domain-containing protein, partial [Candidatus Fermentibacteria bacterium]|nr:T9SS type A sorting domain-containing protein [Candidatus Fermentibacteria bacterium]
SSDRLHMSPSAACDGDQVFVFWVETNENQSQFGLYGQKFSATGDRLWTDSGLELLPLESSQISYVRTLSEASGLYIGYLVGSVGTAVRSFRTDYDGSVTWGPTTLSAPGLGGKGDLGVCVGHGESAYFTWQDARNESGIYAQNVNLDGSLGPFLGIGSGSIPATPVINVFPSPTAGIVNISFTMKTSGSAALDVYDISGRHVKNLLSGEINRGTHTIIWDRCSNAGESSASGLYFVRLGTPSGEITGKVILL